MEYLNAQEVAQMLKLTLRRVQQMCAKGEFAGAYKQGKSWLIPINAVKLAKTSAKRAVGSTDNRAMPIGVSNFKRAVSEYFYVDKTLFIKEIIDLKPQVILFTRPRRFGKTLNADMLRTYFEKTDEDTSVYFKNKKIWACGEKYRRYQGKYPVIYLSFKDVKFPTWKDAFEKLKAIFQDEFARHKQAADNTDLEEHERSYYQKILNGTATEVELTNCLAALTKILYAHYNVEPIVFIDGYDTPVRQGFLHGYYDETVLFLRNLFSGGFKDNKYLSFGYLTGILNVGQEGVFEGMNNIISNSVLDDRFNKYFGFTKEEVWELLLKFNVKNKFPEICEWYDGYNFGGQEVFNPWSIISYMANSCRPRAFWQSTGNNAFLGELVCSAPRETRDSILALLQGQAVLTYVDTNVKLADVQKNSLTLFGFLSAFGYLKTTIQGNYDDICRCLVSIPDREIFTVFSKEIIAKLDEIIPLNYAVAIQQALAERDFENVQTAFRDWLMRTVSNNAAMEENYFRDFILSVAAIVGNRYVVRSERDANEGRFGVSLFPRAKEYPAIFIEIKEGKQPNDNLSDLAKAAILKIDQKQHDVNLRNRGIDRIFKYGIAFNGKNVALVSVK